MTVSQVQLSSYKKVYLDASVLAYWVIKEANPTRVLSKRAEKCRRLLDMYTDQKLNVRLQTSEWAMCELAQYLFDRVAMKKFPFEGFELREVRKLKQQLDLPAKEREDMLQLASSFEKLLHDLDVEMLPVKFEFLLIHDLVYRYAIGTGDAIHVLTATGASDYLVTVDSDLIQAKIGQVEVLDPGTLTNKRELRESPKSSSSS